MKKSIRGGEVTNGAIPVAPVKRGPKKLTPYEMAIKTSGRNSPHAKAQKYISEQKAKGKRPSLKQIGLIMYPKNK